LASAGIDWQALLGAVQSLDLALLVDAEHQGMFGWVEVQADNIEELCGEVGVVTHLEGTAQVRFQSVGVPDPVDQGAVGAERFGKGACAPVGRVRRLLLGRHLDDPSDKSLACLRRSSTAWRIPFEAGNARLCEAVTRTSYGAAADVQLHRDVLILLALGSGQHNPGPCNQSSLGAAPAGPSFQDQAVCIVQGDLTSTSHGHILLSEAYTP